MITNENDLDTKLMEDMEPQLFNFLKTGVNSFIKCDLVRFFHENSTTADTADDIARYAGRAQADIEKELIDLVDVGILDQELVGEMSVFSLATDQTTRELIEQFVLACNDRRFRIKVIYHIIQKMEALV